MYIYIVYTSMNVCIFMADSGLAEAKINPTSKVMHSDGTKVKLNTKKETCRKTGREIGNIQRTHSKHPNTHAHTVQCNICLQ